VSSSTTKVYLVISSTHDQKNKKLHNFAHYVVVKFTISNQVMLHSAKKCAWKIIY